MIYIGTYPYKEILEYTKYMGRKVDKRLKRDIVQLLNNDLDTSRVKEVSDFEELLTMDFTRLKSIYNNFKKPFGIEGIENKIEFFKAMRDEVLDKVDDINKKKYIENIYSNIILRLEKDKNSIIEFKDKYRYFTRGRVGTEKKNNIELSKALKLTICPYCNRNFINNRGDRESGRQFDHFYSRHEVPYFALSLYNLVPSCSVCNHIKQNSNNMTCCPFDPENAVERKLKFKVEFPTGNISVQKTVPDVETLKLNEAYEINSEDVKRLFNEEKKYCRDYRKRLLEKIDPTYRFLLSEQQFDRMIFGEAIYLDHKKFRNEPLSYLKYDTYKTIKKFYKH